MTVKTYIHEGQKFLGDLSHEDLAQEDELVDGVREDGRGYLQKSRQLFQKLAVQGLKRRSALVDIFG